MYHCEGHGEGRNKSTKGCKAFRAELIEDYVWKGVVGILGDRSMLEKAADDWIGTLPVNGDDYRARITELDKKLADIERIRTTQLVQYATMGIDPVVVKAAQDKFEQDAKELTAQRAVAQTLLSELETALDRRTQIVALAEVSPDRLLHLAPHIKAQVIEMLDLQVKITADPKNARLAHPCKIEAFFRENEKLVPGALTNAQWDRLVAEIPELSPKNRKVSLRTVMDAGFHKVRENVRWKQLPAAYGPEMSLRAIWLQWMKTDLLERVVAVLGEYDGTPVEDRELPEMRITGVLEGTLASMMGQTEVNDVLAPSGTASSEAIQERASKWSTRSVPRFSMDLGRSAA
jgi:transposase